MNLKPIEIERKLKKIDKSIELVKSTAFHAIRKIYNPHVIDDRNQYYGCDCSWDCDCPNKSEQRDSKVKQIIDSMEKDLTDLKKEKTYLKSLQ